MTREIVGTTFEEHVEGIGSFTFARRTMRAEFRINAEYARLTEGVSPVPDQLHVSADAVATLKILTVKAPDGWNIDDLDPLETDSYVKILTVWRALRAREDAFRKSNKSGVKAEG